MFRRGLILGSFLKLAQVISGYCAVTTYSTSIFADKNDESASLKATVYIGIANLSAVAIFTFIVDSIIIIVY